MVTQFRSGINHPFAEMGRELLKRMRASFQSKALCVSSCSRSFVLCLAGVQVFMSEMVNWKLGSLKPEEGHSAGGALMDALRSTVWNEDSLITNYQLFSTIVLSFILGVQYCGLHPVGI